MATHSARFGGHRFDGTLFIEAYRKARPALAECGLPGLKTAHALLFELRSLINPGGWWLRDGQEVEAITPAQGKPGAGYLIEDATALERAYLSKATTAGSSLAGTCVAITACLRDDSDCNLQLLQTSARAGHAFVTLAGTVAEAPQSAIFDFNLAQALHPLELTAVRGTQRRQTLRHILNRYDS